MKKFSKKALLIIALVLCLSTTAGVSIAYFSDYEAASGGATLALGGKTEMTEGKSTDKKDVVITNTGETNMIVRVGIFGPEGMQDPAAKNGWEKSTKDGFYYYSAVLSPNESTGAGNLMASMKFDWQGEKPEFNFDVTVVHESAQAVFDNDTEKLVVPDGWDADMVKKMAPAPVGGKEAN